MELTHTFTVAAPVEHTWTALNDIESVAGCFPGAAITSTDGDTFTGTCKVKLGPIALVYNGSGAFVEKDETAHTMKIDAKGKDKRGNGTAGAQILASLSEVGGQTQVEVVTDLAITGRPAQFGRGVMQDVSDKLLGQFVTCLQDKVGNKSAPEDEGATDTDAPSPEHTEAAETGAVVDSAGTSGTPPTPAGTEPMPGPRASTVRPRSSAVDDDALDLGGAILPILFKTYWKPVLAMAAALGVVAYLTSRRPASRV